MNRKQTIKLQQSGQNKSNLYEGTTDLQEIESTEIHVKLHVRDVISKNQVMANFVGQITLILLQINCKGAKKMDRYSMY